MKEIRYGSPKKGENAMTNSEVYIVTTSLNLWWGFYGLDESENGDCVWIYDRPDDRGEGLAKTFVGSDSVCAIFWKWEPPPSKSILLRNISIGRRWSLRCWPTAGDFSISGPGGPSICGRSVRKKRFAVTPSMRTDFLALRLFRKNRVPGCANRKTRCTSRLSGRCGGFVWNKACGLERALRPMER